MSLVSVGGLDVSSHPAYVRDPAQDKQGVPSSCISGFLEGGGDRGVKREIYSRVIGESSSVDRSSETASSESSSIGIAGDSEDEDEDENEDEEGEVQSKVSGGLGSLGSLEDSLPIKRGLSNHFTGKSKSFANLMEVSKMKEVEKAEKPLNKRRRTLLACKWSRRSSFYTWSNPNSMSLLPLNEHQEEDSSEEQEEHKSFDSPSSLFSKDLQQQQQQH